MARYQQNVDGTAAIDPDRGSGDQSKKIAQLRPLSEVLDRDQDRAGLRDLDARVAAARGLTRRQRDANRIYPRGTPAQIPYPVMERRLPHPDQIRLPLSGRQQKARRKTMTAVQQALPKAQAEALRQLLKPQGTAWRRINEALSEATGDIDALDPAEQRTARRVDRAIQAYEDRNDRGHVLYANIEMPKAVNRTSIAPFIERHFQPGDEFSFDRYTLGGHSLHEVDPANDPAGRVAVFELQTRRGIYLGHSEGGDSTGHLLPRGLRLRVVGTHKATYRTRSGTEGTRMIIQLEDITPEPESERQP